VVLAVKALSVIGTVLALAPAVEAGVPRRNGNDALRSPRHVDRNARHALSPGFRRCIAESALRLGLPDARHAGHPMRQRAPDVKQ
jgi:hypothetical protein